MIMAKKRSEVSLARKVSYLSLALMEIEECKDSRFKMDAEGLACQYSHHPKLKRQDFEGIMNMSINDILKSINISNESL